MIGGQAIKSTVMDLAPSTRTSGLKSSFVKGKDAISFESLLSNKAVSDSTLSQSPEKSISETKKTSTNKELIDDNTPVKERNSSSNDVKGEVVKTEATHATNETEIDDSKLDTVAKVVEEVKEIVLKTLKISEEELESLMGVLGLTMLDLLNPEALKQLTLESAGTNDFMMLLTDEGLNQQLTNLLDQVQDVLDKYGVTQQDLTNLVSNEGEFNKLMEKIMENSKRTMMTDSSQNAGSIDEETNAELKNLSTNSTSNTSSSTSQESSIEFSVEHYNQENGASSQSNSDADQNKEQGLSKTELANQFLDQMVNSTKTSQAQFSQQVEHLSEIREIANQILDQIKLVIKPAQTSMEFTLNPDNLGKVALNITSKEGIMTATFTTQSQIAKEALESQLQIFKDNLNNQGLKVEAIEVNVSNFSFEGSNQMEQSNSNQQEAAKGKKTTLRMDTEDADFLEEVAGLVQDDSADYGNNFDYTA